MHFEVAIDEFGTATQTAEGWTLVSLAESQAAKLTAETPKLLGGGLKAFHGKKFSRKSEDRYRDFLNLLKECCRASSGGFIACTLNDEAWHEKFRTFAEQTMEATFLKAGIPLTADHLEMLRKVVSPLFTYQRVAAQRVGGGHTVAVTLDDSTLTRQFNTASVVFGGHTFTLPHLAGMLYRAYRTRCFPTSPKVPGDEIRTAPDEDSPLVQAADVVGNFSTAYIFQRLGKKTNANDLKAKIFHDVFAECGIDEVDHATSVEMAGDDLRLKRPGAYTFVVS